VPSARHERDAVHEDPLSVVPALLGRLVDAVVQTEAAALLDAHEAQPPPRRALRVAR
jgi:hypothetical protein